MYSQFYSVLDIVSIIVDEMVGTLLSSSKNCDTRMT